MGLIILISALCYLSAYLVWYYLIRAQIIDDIRQSLFGLRTSLFMKFNESNYDIDHPTHHTIRNRINIIIKDIDEISISSIASYLISSALGILPEPINKEKNDINTYNGINKEFKLELIAIEIAMMVHMLMAIFYRNLFFIICIRTFFAIKGFINIHLDINEKVKKIGGGLFIHVANRHTVVMQ